MATGDYSTSQWIGGIILVSTAFISFVSTLTTLFLIHDMKRWNGYLLLIYNMTICQMFYDLSFFLVPFYDSSNQVVNVITFLTAAAGLAVAFWTNIISVVLYVIVQYLQSFQIDKYFMTFFCSIVFTSLLFAFFDTFYLHDKEAHRVLFNVYFWTRVASILFNITIQGLISYKLHLMGFSSTPKQQHHPSSSSYSVASAASAAAKDPIRVLSSRLKYYPIVQIITRSGAMWYQLQYGDRWNNVGDTGAFMQILSLCFYSVCLPSAGLGYFIVFLIVQPSAYLHLKKRLRSKYNRTSRWLRRCKRVIYYTTCYCLCCCGSCSGANTTQQGETDGTADGTGTGTGVKERLLHRLSEGDDEDDEEDEDDEVVRVTNTVPPPPMTGDGVPRAGKQKACERAVTGHDGRKGPMQHAGGAQSLTAAAAYYHSNNDEYYSDVASGLGEEEEGGRYAEGYDDDDNSLYEASNGGGDNLSQGEGGGGGGERERERGGKDSDGAPTEDKSSISSTNQKNNQHQQKGSRASSRTSTSSSSSAAAKLGTPQYSNFNNSTTAAGLVGGGSNRSRVSPRAGSSSSSRSKSTVLGDSSTSASSFLLLRRNRSANNLSSNNNNNNNNSNNNYNYNYKGRIVDKRHTRSSNNSHSSSPSEYHYRAEVDSMEKQLAALAAAAGRSEYLTEGELARAAAAGAGAGASTGNTGGTSAFIVTSAGTVGGEAVSEMEEGRRLAEAAAAAAADLPVVGSPKTATATASTGAASDYATAPLSTDNSNMDNYYLDDAATLSGSSNGSGSRSHLINFEDLDEDELAYYIDLSYETVLRKEQNNSRQYQQQQQQQQHAAATGTTTGNGNGNVYNDSSTALAAMHSGDPTIVGGLINCSSSSNNHMNNRNSSQRSRNETASTSSDVGSMGHSFGLGVMSVGNSSNNNNNNNYAIDGDFTAAAATNRRFQVIQTAVNQDTADV